MCVCADLGAPACLCGLAALRSTSGQRGNATQAIAQNHALESRPPAWHIEKERKKALSRAGKVHNALCQHLHAA